MISYYSSGKAPWSNVSCWNCGAHRVEDDFAAGRSGPCPRCGAGTRRHNIPATAQDDVNLLLDALVAILACPDRAEDIARQALAEVRAA